MKNGVGVYLYKEGLDVAFPTHVMHWGQGKDMKFPDEVPEKMWSLIRRAKGSKSLLVTYAWADTPDGTFDGSSRCMKIEGGASRRDGINRAVGRLVKKAAEEGYEACYKDDLPEPMEDDARDALMADLAT